jgi:hypothetical protein
MHSRHAVTVLLTVTMAAFAFLAAGCGRGGDSPSVASLGSSHGSTTTTQSTLSSGGSAGSGGGGTLTMKAAGGAKFAACMRRNGVPNFPDPSSGGDLTIGPGSGINPSSPAFRKAQQTCSKLLPHGGQPTPQQVAQARQQALKFSACMRGHGVKDFPDPTFSAGRIAIQVKGGPGTDLNPRSPVFQAAQKACRSDLPGKLQDGTATGGGK